MLKRRTLLQGMIVLPLISLVGACDGGQPQTQKSLRPVPLQSGDECAVCGMLISGFPGPKAEVLDTQGLVLKFCSTRDLLTWWLQPENRNLQGQVYVHDMAHNSWQHPDDRRFCDARTAWYVIGSDLPGAMGPTLASFAKETEAHEFALNHGGKVLAYGDLNLDVLGSLRAGMSSPG